MNKQIHELTVIELLNGLEDKRFSAVDIVKHYFDRINKYNNQLNVYLYINENAVKLAEEADKERANKIKKPLLGIPVAVKDNFLTIGMPTTAGSLVLKDYYPQYESTVTRRLLEGGAIILGKTNMDAWAHGSSTETSSYGPTLNPWDLGRLPGGSSGGSAAAIAARLTPIAIGSETAGSIRQPSAWCGVTGFKPSYGRVSRYGVVAMASSTDSPGPIAQNVEDAALITSIIAGQDKFDATTSPKETERYHQLLDRKDLKGIKVGLVKEYLLDSMREEVKTLIRNSAKHLESLGAHVEEISLMDPQYAIGVYTVVMRSEVSSNLARYDGVRFGHGRETFGAEAKRRIMLGTYTLSAGYYDAYYKKAMAVRTKIVSEFENTFKNFDVFIGAISPGPALKVGATKDEPMFGEMEDILVEPSSLAGLTSAGVPCGFVDDLPIGLQITGNQFDEAKVLDIAHIYQKTTNFVKFPSKYQI
ncbi:Asp-tRNA(Asn)/Glu-tRNA(Gln) amidotransferase subunit GatA [Candidatus Collierbacteria bacterium]|nr:Asp-tRNA(Asn)/Glu-tRNA(Gln) amidotransferase subunit GatA [Candidatus Collierbacteria bacterium]